MQEYLKITEANVPRKNTEKSTPSSKRNGHIIETQSESETSSKKAKVQFLEHEVKIRDSEIYALNDKIHDLQSQIIQIKDELYKEESPARQVLSTSITV